MITETFIDKKEWGAGAWENEADLVMWLFFDIPCKMRRTELTGAWCGYVALPKNHPWNDLDLYDVPSDVHGGITFGPERIKGGTFPADFTGEPLLWVGFDCAHAYDYLPKYSKYASMLLLAKRYWTQDEVIRETNKLAREVLSYGSSN